MVCTRPGRSRAASWCRRRQKWMNFYTKVLSKFAANKRLKLTVCFELEGEELISQQKIEETKVALRELGLDDRIEQE